MEDTKVIYHIDDEDTPYLIKLTIPPDTVTLGDFKNALNRPNYKFFFKSLDADFGVVKEEISNDDSKLPCFNGKVISWLVSADSSTKSDHHSSSADGQTSGHLPIQNKPVARLSQGDYWGHSQSYEPPSANKGSEPAQVPSEQEHAVGTTGHTLDDCETCAETDSMYSGDRVPPLRNFHAYKHGSRLLKFGQRAQNYETSSSLMSSDVESTSFFDSEDESSRFSTATGTTGASSSKYARHRKQRRRRRLIPVRRNSEDASSFSSMTDSTMSLNVITVTLNMDTVNFLGISIVGQSNKAGDGGIYVGSIMRGGAVAQDGRIEPGDMILEVNNISFEDMSNDEAVRVLREEVQKPGPITLVVAKCWDPSPKDYFTVPRQEPVRPIDPRAWVLHTNAMTGALCSSGASPFPGPGSPSTMGLMQGNFLGVGNNSGIPLSAVPQLLPPSLANLGALPSSCNMTSKSLPDVGEPIDASVNDARGYRSGGPGSSGGGGGVPGSTKTTGSRSGVDIDSKGAPTLLGIGKSVNSLTVSTDMASIVHSMLLPDSGLSIHDRTWLKITIPNAFIGSDLVDWLYAHVDGFHDRKDARRYAGELLRYGYIRHTVNKNTFSEQCYYVFADISSALAHLNLDEVDSVSEVGAQVGPSNSNSRGLLTQRYPQMHHPMPDSTSCGLTVLPSQNSSSAMFGILGHFPPHSGVDGCVSMIPQPGPHYPYQPMMYPVQGTPVSNSCFVDTAATASNPTSTMQAQLRLNGLSAGALDGTISQPVIYPTPCLEAQGFQAVGFAARNQPTGHAHPLTRQQHQAGNSSSSSSSHSSASSASSSSSTASSGNCPTRNTRMNVHTSSAGSGNALCDKLSDSTAPSSALVTHSASTRNPPQSVKSTSGASSSSSVSRQNGTGTSAAGSGSGGASICRMPVRPCPRPETMDSKSEQKPQTLRVGPDVATKSGSCAASSSLHTPGPSNRTHR